MHPSHVFQILKHVGVVFYVGPSERRLPPWEPPKSAIPQRVTHFLKRIPTFRDVRNFGGPAFAKNDSYMSRCPKFRRSHFSKTTPTFLSKGVPHFRRLCPKCGSPFSAILRQMWESFVRDISRKTTPTIRFSEGCGTRFLEAPTVGVIFQTGPTGYQTLYVLF